MKILRDNCGRPGPAENGFTLVDVMIGTLVMGVVVAALGTGITFAVGLARVNSKTLRATQILTEKMDLIRAASWIQITNGYSFIPRNFTSSFYNAGSTNAVVYDGLVTIANTGATESYASNLKQVTVTVTWTSANISRSRSATTFVSPYGIQNYSY